MFRQAKKGGNEEKQSKASPSDVPIKNLDLISGFLGSDGEFRKGFRRPIMYGNCVQETLTVLFTCGRRPTGHVMMAVVVVVVVVVIVVVVGGEQLLYMGPPRAHVWFSKIQKKFPIFLFF